MTNPSATALPFSMTSDGHDSLVTRAVGAEQRVAQLSQLYAAVSQLWLAGDEVDVLTVIKEVAANLLGTEEMGIYEVLPLGSVCTLIDGIGLDVDRFGMIL